MGHALTRAGGAVDVADAALAIAETEPERALELVADRTTGGSDRKADAIAEWARGIALRRLGKFREAFVALERASRELNAAGETTLAARVDIALSHELLAAGRTSDALALLASTEERVSGVDAAKVASQRALVDFRSGRHSDAIASWNRAVTLLSRAGERLEVGKAVHNRGLVYAYLGRFADAEADLSRAEELFVRGGDLVGVAEVAHNRGFVATLRGDLPGALRWFDEAQQQLRSMQVSRPTMFVDRAEGLLAAGLSGEAATVAVAAVGQLEAAGAEADIAEACLLAARAHQARGDLGAAASWAHRAAALFEAQDRPGYAVLAEYVATRADVAASRAGVAALNAPEDWGDRLRAAGWWVTAIEADTFAASLLLDASRHDDASVLLARLLRMRQIPSIDRARAWMEVVRLRSGVGDTVGARRAARAALKWAAKHHEVLGSPELRGRLGDLFEAVAALGAGSSVADHVRAFWWTETVRDTFARPRDRTEPEVPEAVAARIALRETTARLDQEPRSARSAASLLRQRAALEELIRRHSRHAISRAREDPANSRQRRREVARAIADHLVVQYQTVGDSVVALTRYRGTYRRVDLGQVAGIRRATAALRMSINRAARGSISAAGTDGVLPLATTLDQLIGRPVWGRDCPDRTLIVPNPLLSSLPWAALPSLHGAVFVVSPSVGSWVRGERAVARRSPPTVAVAGPGATHAVAEVNDVARLHQPNASALLPSEATVSRVLDAIGRASLVHIAAHGSFRSDSPLLSSIRLVDGPLTGYDIDQLDQVPAIVVLSGCDTAMDVAEGGSAGLVRLLLGRGVACVIATPNPVQDRFSAPFMLAFHSALAAGERPAEALRQARRRALSGPAMLVARSFVCYGAG